MITSQEMKELEANCGLTGVALMERASKSFVAEFLKDVSIKGKKVLVCCYHGKNGGEGMAIADLLSKETEIDLLFIGDEEKMFKETAHFFHHINHNALIQFVTLDTVDFSEYDIIIDAILGLGIHHYLKPEIAVTIKHINESSALKVSVDVPTGIHPDSGEVVNIAVEPDLVITFHDIKPGLLKYGEKVRIVSLGFRVL